MRVPVLLRALLVALLFLFGLPMSSGVGVSHATEWSAKPSVRVATEYDDNIRLTTQPHNSVHGLTTAPKLDLGVRSYIWNLYGSAEYERKKYSGEKYLDTDNQYFTLGGGYSTERSTWQLYSSLIKVSTLANELVPTNTYIQGYSYYFPVVDKTQTHRMREILTISPSWQWSLDERKQLQLSYKYNSDSYVDGSSLGLSDSSTRSATIKFTNQISPVDQVFLSGIYTHFNTPEVTHAAEIDIYTYVANAVNPLLVSNKSRSDSYQAGISHAFSESMRGVFSIASRRTNTEQLYRTCPSPNGMYLFSATAPLLYPSFGEPCSAPYVYRTAFSVQSSTVFSGSLEVLHESTNVSIAVSRNFSSGSAGDQVQNDTLSFGVKRTFASRLTGDVSGNVSKYTSETGTVSNFNYQSYQIQPSLVWQWTEELSVNVTYRYTDMKRSWESKPASSNYVYFGLVYQWPKMSFSR